MVCLLPFASKLRADGVTVTTSSPGWVQTAPGTFVLPADLSAIGCGVENAITREPQGQFNFNVSSRTVSPTRGDLRAVLITTGVVSQTRPLFFYRTGNRPFIELPTA